MSPAFSDVPLADIAKPISRMVEVTPGQSYRTIGVKWWGQGAYERETIDGSRTAAKTLSLVRREDLIINKIWVRHGSTAIAGPDVDGCAASSEFPTFTLDKDQVIPRWLHWFTKTPNFWARCEALSQGTSGKNRIKPELFLTIRVPLPPVVEQQRVIARIDELALQIQLARTLKEQAAEEAHVLIGALVSELFTKGLQGGWESGFLGDYVLSDCYGTSEKTSDDDSGIPILRMGNIQRGRFDFSDLKYLHLSEQAREKLLLKGGDILVNRTNSAELVGKCAVFESDEEFSFASYLIRLRLDSKRADPHLVARYINSPLGRAYMLTEKTQMTGQANVNSTKLKALPIALPPLPEQSRIITALDTLEAEIDALKHLQAQTTAELDAMLPSILDRAFKGEL